MYTDHETTPFLSPNGNGDDRETNSPPTAPATPHFKQPLKILAMIVSIVSLSAFGILLASYVCMAQGPFGSVYSSQDTARDLLICVRIFFWCSSTVN